MAGSPNSDMKVMVIAGTRPEWIRLSATISALESACKTTIVHTGQNYDYELNEVFFKDLKLRKPDYFLDAVKETATQTIGAIIIEVDKVLVKECPDAVLILGDTNSCLAAIAARKNKVPVYHMEAGNRCFDFNVPEELNRRIVDQVSDFNLCYTEHARRHLLSEGFEHRRLYVTGSPMREVLDNNKDAIARSDILRALELSSKAYFLASFHREENVDNKSNLITIVSSLEKLSSTHDLPVIVSTHPRTRKRMVEFGMQPSDNLTFLKPFGFHDYNKLQLEAACVISDSGTISEESAIMGFPAVTIRNALERPEAMDTGTIILTGLEERTIENCVGLVMQDAKSGNFPPVPVDYLPDNTSQRVLRLIMGTSGLNAKWRGLENQR
ncbi:MAG: UDP-N-acetylglucosamine 2-epimerase (non-hydrolyzing) [Pseudomonadota bacterium]